MLVASGDRAPLEHSLALYTQVLLVTAFAVRAKCYCYFSQEIKPFLKFFWVVNIKNAVFSKLET